MNADQATTWTNWTNWTNWAFGRAEPPLRGIAMHGPGLSLSAGLPRLGNALRKVGPTCPSSPLRADMLPRLGRALRRVAALGEVALLGLASLARRKPLPDCPRRYTLALLCAPLLLACPNAHAQLINGDFAPPAPLQAWQVVSYGSAPQVSLDSAVRLQGRPSLRVASSQPTDTALGQEIRLRPNRLYLAVCWVRTQGLQPRGASLLGALMVQHAAALGAGAIAGSASHSGDTPWTRLAVPFISPPEGVTRISLFFAGFGKGVGAAWFSGVGVKPLNARTLPITVSRNPLCPGRINPFQYGQFIEYLCDLVPGMWAEKLYDGSFEGLTPYHFAYIRETDFKEKPWYPSGATNRAECTRDTEFHVSGDRSMKVAIEPGAPCAAGVSQSGIYVQKGELLRFRISIRQEGLRHPVVVQLESGGHDLGRASFAADSEWNAFETTFRPDQTAGCATLSIQAEGPGTFWLDNASLMPERTEGGWRPDVARALAALKPGIIRFGGSTLEEPSYSDFNWRKTIGPVDKRTPFHAWGGLQPTGPGLEEIVQLIQAARAEPLMCVPFDHNTPAEAAAEVQYFNGGTDTPMGAERARNGHAAPYHIRYWQVGNERSGPAYEEGLAAFCQAMKQADPSIRLLSSFPTPAVIQSAWHWLDYVCPHQYGCADLQAMQAEIDSIRHMIRDYGHGRDIRIAVTEWNTTAGDMGPRRAMLWTLGNALACARYQNLLHRNADIVEIANRSNLTNSFCSGVIQTNRRSLYLTPTYYAQQLYATLAGTRPLNIEAGEGAAAPPDVSATLSEDGKTLTLFAINDSGAELERPIDLRAVGGAAGAITVWTLQDSDHSGSPDVANSFDRPERIAPVRSTLAPRGSTIDFTFPPYSLTVLVVPVG